MNRNVIKVLATILLVIVLVATTVTIANATSEYKASEQNAKDMFQKATDSTGTSDAATSIIGSIITIVQIIGVGVAIIMLIVLAIKYISAAPGDKAEIKKHAVVYVVGAIVLFAASGILGIIKNFASAFNVGNENGMG